MFICIFIILSLSVFVSLFVSFYFYFQWFSSVTKPLPWWIPQSVSVLYGCQQEVGTLCDLLVVADVTDASVQWDHVTGHHVETKLFHRGLDRVLVLRAQDQWLGSFPWTARDTRRFGLLGLQVSQDALLQDGAAVGMGVCLEGGILPLDHLLLIGLLTGMLRLLLTSCRRQCWEGWIHKTSFSLQNGQCTWLLQLRLSLVQNVLIQWQFQCRFDVRTIFLFIAEVLKPVSTTTKTNQFLHSTKLQFSILLLIRFSI